ncbi:hypothetical protein CP985_14375 [Malaciobacter mytili LMG 24559]|uniref:Uncharacterized protein n=1 Tax=Malaciobacter mytili LMG 24559 TaxID=1032238 RepID=A0AAX2ACH7_9BACT|nr:hypothetical protein [Malaciobacter mytili]AXH16324.1 hypothetical protein AMYT_a0024 [Malaciobacter mytili LMG 24559]RXK12390.1 hypothetical protein CP985_14375 [Malaciobacter mytili LMG 24559]
MIKLLEDGDWKLISREKLENELYLKNRALVKDEVSNKIIRIIIDYDNDLHYYIYDSSIKINYQKDAISENCEDNYLINDMIEDLPLDSLDRVFKAAMES